MTEMQAEKGPALLVNTAKQGRPFTSFWLKNNDYT